MPSFRVQSQHAVLQLLLGLIFMCVGLGVSKYVNFIIGGENAEEGRFKFIAFIKRDGDYKCGGSLITPKHVLTAKHCVQRTDFSVYEIVLGEYDRRTSSGREQSYGVVNIMKHEDADTDVGLVELNGTATLNEAVTMVDLADTLPPVGSEVTAMGWGYVQSGRTIEADVLQTVDIPIANNSDCDREYGKPPRTNEICVGDETKPSYTNICKGDSGSPIVYNITFPNGTHVIQQIGIVQGGHDNCPAGYRFAIAVDVPKIRDWVIGKLLGPTTTEVPTTLEVTSLSTPMVHTVPEVNTTLTSTPPQGHTTIYIIVGVFCGLAVILVVVCIGIRCYQSKKGTERVSARFTQH